MCRTTRVPLQVLIGASGRGLVEAQNALDQHAASAPTRFRITTVTVRLPVRIAAGLGVAPARSSKARLAFTFRREEKPCR